MIITMKCKGGRDCAVAAVGTATGSTYEHSARALNHVDLPGPLESPILSNPLNVYRAIARLGFWKRNLTWADLLAGNFAPMRAIVLIKNSLIEQHWIVLGSTTLDLRTNERSFRCYWGDSETPRVVSEKTMKKYFLTSWPNCAFEVYEASVWRVWWERFKAIFRPN